MTKKQKIAELKSFLDKLYPKTECFLHSDTEYGFLIAVILSAQAQDRIVNSVTPLLFKRYKSLVELSTATKEDVLNIIRPVGLGPTKAANIVLLAQTLVKKYNSSVPHDMESLESLPGVGHKTASVFLGEKLNAHVIPVDTHVMRVCQRLSIVSNKDTPKKIQNILEKNFIGEDHMNFHRQIISFGRNICIAGEKRKCQLCSLSCKNRKKD